MTIPAFSEKCDTQRPEAVVPRRGAILIGRTGGLVELVIDHPAVSLRHAKVFRRGGSAYISDLGSSSGTFVNGHRVHSDAELPIGATVAIGPIRLTYDGRRLVQSEDAHAGVALACVDLSITLHARGRNHTQIQLLHDVCLAVQPNELVCVIGPSGSGKSTLLSVLSGRRPPDKGQVFIKGDSLSRAFESLKHELAYVPQHEALIQPLTVRQALTYSAALRLPRDTKPEELDATVTRLLGDVGLEGRDHVRIRDLSGGQRKRVGLAAEIAHRPNIVFIDEATSGLDERGDFEIMSLVRNLCERGLTVVCITHNTLNIERTANRVIVLSREGRLACYGTTAEVCRYFRVDRLGDVYLALSARSPAEWQEKFRRNPLWHTHVGQWMPPPEGTRVRDNVKVASPRPVDDGDYIAAYGRRFGYWRQAWLLTHRMVLIQVMDPRPTLMALVQAGFVGLLLVAFFGDLELGGEPLKRLADCRTAAFLLVVSVFWLGCNNAAPEIVRERRLFEQERAVAVKPLPYALSKVVVLGTISICQSMVVFTLMCLHSRLPGDGGMAGGLWRTAVITGTGLLGTLIGLAISSCVRSESVAVRAVPMLMIPQIVLADVLSPLDGWLGWCGPAVTSSYWTFLAFTAGTDAYLAPGGAVTPTIWATTALATHAALAGLALLMGLGRRID